MEATETPATIITVMSSPEFEDTSERLEIPIVHTLKQPMGWDELCGNPSST